MLELQSISASYGAIQALDDVSLRVNAGEIVSLIGANGAGKSTLLNAISGIVPTRSGSITFEGQRIDGLRPEQIVRRQLIQVPEGRQIFAGMSVVENLMLGAYVCHGTPLDDRLDAVYTMFPRLKERRHQLAGSFSGGEQQMLAIGRALMSQPRLLLLDEPSMGLAPLMIQTIFRALETLNAGGLAILLIEQNATAALQLSKRAYVLVNGKIVETGTSAELLKDDYIREAFLGRTAA